MTPPTRVGSVCIWSDEEDGTWIASVTYIVPSLDGGGSAVEHELDIARCDTPGQALDAAVKWGKDRALEVFVEGMSTEVIRPGTVK